MKTNIYPSIDDEDFSIKLANHPHFKDYKYDEKFYITKKEHTQEDKEQILQQLIEDANNKCSGSGGYIYTKIQLFISTFISLNTPYNSVLLYHGVGVGKSCSSILIADNFRHYINKINQKNKNNLKKIIVLTSTSIQSGFKTEIFDEKFHNSKVDQNSFKCTSNEYLDELEIYKKSKSKKDFNKKITENNFIFTGYQKFHNDYGHLETKQQFDEYFSDTVIIIDEVHNLRTDDDIDETSSQESEKAKQAKECRLLLLKILNTLLTVST